MLYAFVCMVYRQRRWPIKRTRKAHLLFQHGRDIHYSLIDGDIWKTLPHHINIKIWSRTCLHAGHMVGGEMSCICSRKLWRKGKMGLCFVPGTHPWLSHECPGYSTGVIRVLGHFDTRLSYSTHPHSTQHFNTSSTQATGTGWENTDHSSDGFLFATNKLILKR